MLFNIPGKKLVAGINLSFEFVKKWKEILTEMFFMYKTVEFKTSKKLL